MNRRDLANVLLLVGAIALSLWSIHGSTRLLAAVTTSSTTATVVDAAGTVHPVHQYQRVLSLGLIGDAILLSVCEPTRIAGLSIWSKEQPDAFRAAGLPRLHGLDDLEAILAIRPDVVLVSTFGGESERMTRLREAGIRVVDLGIPRGLASYCANLRLVASLLAVPERGEREALRQEQRSAAVAADIPAERRPRAIYLAVVGEVLFGGATGTSFHDALVLGGCRDAGSEAGWLAWPELTPERVLAVSPEVIITQAGMAADLRKRAGLDRLQARWIEIEAPLLQDPGSLIVDAAQAIRAGVHPR